MMSGLFSEFAFGFNGWINREKAIPIPGCPAAPLRRVRTGRLLVAYRSSRFDPVIFYGKIDRQMVPYNRFHRPLHPLLKKPVSIRIHFCRNTDRGCKVTVFLSVGVDLQIRALFYVKLPARPRYIPIQSGIPCRRCICQPLPSAGRIGPGRAAGDQGQAFHAHRP